jgi:hypothetical protein
MGVYQSWGKIGASEVEDLPGLKAVVYAYDSAFMDRNSNPFSYEACEYIDHGAIHEIEVAGELSRGGIYKILVHWRFMILGNLATRNEKFPK